VRETSTRFGVEPSAIRATATTCRRLDIVRRSCGAVGLVARAATAGAAVITKIVRRALHRLIRASGELFRSPSYPKPCATDRLEGVCAVAGRFFSVSVFGGFPDALQSRCCDADCFNREELLMEAALLQQAPRVERETPMGAAGGAIVEARAVEKRYDTGQLEVHALRGVSFSVGRGEMVAIMGPSGSGKTTLLNCLSGLDRIDDGEVLIEGVALGSMSDVERTDYRARRMGFVFQFYNLMPVLSAVENVELPLLVARVSAKEARRRALAALEMVGLGERAAHVPDELSGGQRQRATIARALVNDPAIVWADEPTGDLDSENAQEIVGLMRTLNRERGLTFLIVTHDISVGRATDRIVRMVDGRIVDEERLEVRV
jgi:putative ABC transport system ATP-binding protein